MIIQVIQRFIKVACLRIFFAKRIVPINNGNPRCEGKTFNTSHAVRSLLFAITARSAVSIEVSLTSYYYYYFSNHI